MFVKCLEDENHIGMTDYDHHNEGPASAGNHEAVPTLCNTSFANGKLTMFLSPLCI